MNKGEINIPKGPKFLQNGGEMGRIIEVYDWSKHPLGVPEDWPLSLKMAVSNMLKTAFPKFILWGKEFFCFYNDAYRPSLGNQGKHPAILGEKFEDAFPELVHTLKKEAENVWKTGEATWHENQLVSIFRNGRMEEVYWTFSYSVLIGEEDETVGISITCIETTEAVRNLQLLQESENQLAFAIDAAELGTWDYNPLTNSFTGNDRLMDWMGIAKGMNISMEQAMDTIVPEDVYRVTSSINKSLAGRLEGRFIERFGIRNTRTNEVRIVQAQGKVRFRNPKSPYRITGTLQDVSEQVNYEKRLIFANEKIKKEEQNFRNIVYEAPVGIAIFEGSELVAKMANNSLLSFLKRESEEFIGKKLFESIPELKETLENFYKQVFLKRESVRGTEYQISLPRKGKLKSAYFNFIIHPIQILEGEVKEVMMVVNEVTDIVESKNELAENERQFRNHMQHSPVAMAILRGKDFKIELANNRMLNHLWGRTREEVIGKPLLAVFPELKNQKYPSELLQVLNTGVAIRDKSSKVEIVNDGISKEFYLDYHYIPLSDLDATISGVIVTATDVTDQVLYSKRLEGFAKELENQVTLRTNLLLDANEKLKDSVVKLKQANEELQSFAYVSSHDLQEPLRKIQMYSSLILEKEYSKFSTKGKGYFDKITYAAGRMRTLIDDLLSFSRSNDDITKYELIDFNEVIDQVLEDMAPTIEESEAIITVKDLPMAEAIFFQMRQVFSNLISNAIKFSKKDSRPEILISATEVEESQVQLMNLNHNKKYFEFLISDNGIGFPQGMENKIFEVFQRLHAKHEYEGTGIGLAIVKKVINNHCGLVNAESIEGEGATFKIIFPSKHS
ncbi:PAS domain-containing protein [Cyclobacterium sp. 1_MG-2023]|uniref:PAS domain-containing protein n=1 Tax=Cyclobacterium sp. 1_MG-2023 TaxID=3062681 RepID=UPI0026E2EA5C|nr:PAS domain-containing protein [Cyclobacterium sp. 1_MG-2023]MDO6440408.1 PAS domain-containing protein [Cyclobacterium sp. 1_MG-2023]